MNKELEKTQPLVGDIKTLIAESKQQLAISVNTSMSMLYWNIGKRINEEVLQEKRAEYGKQVIGMLSQHLISEYGSSFSEKNLRRMMQFATAFPEKEIVVPMIRQLSWTHIIR